MAQFFSGEKTAQFQWLEIKEEEEHLDRPGNIYINNRCTFPSFCQNYDRNKKSLLHKL